MFGFKKKSKVHVANIKGEDNLSLSVLRFDGELNDQLIEHFRQYYDQNSDLSKNSGAISPKSILSLLGTGTASAGGAAALSSKLFVATANPASLMSIGNGVGSAVMGTSGIVGQAAFVPAASAILPVALPVIAFQAVTTVIILKQFDAVHKKLSHIDKNISKILQREEASFAGEIISATHRIERLESQLYVSKKFTTEMITTFCLLESKVNPSFERYRILYETEKLDAKSDDSGRRSKHHDSHFSIAFSILDLRIDLLRIKIALQDAPEQLEYLIQKFTTKSNEYKKLWTKIKGDPVLAQNISEELQLAIKEMNFWQRNMPKWLGGNSGQRKDFQKKKIELEEHAKAIDGTLDSMIDVGEILIPESTPDKPVSLVYWKDHLGEHSFYTTELNFISQMVKKKAG